MAITNTDLSATLQRREKGYSDIVANHIPLLKLFKKKGRYMKWDGGHPYQWNLEVSEDTSEPSFDGYDTIPVSPLDNVVTAQANMKYYAKVVAISTPEKLRNTGMQVFKLLDQKEKSQLTAMKQQLAAHQYLDGTGNSSKRITGLDAIVSSSPTSGTLFNVSRATYSAHRNRVKDTNGAALDISDGNPIMWNDMEILRTECGRQESGGDGDRYPDVIIGTEAYFQRYQQVAHIMGFRIVDNDVADAGFDALKFHNAMIIGDVNCPNDAGGDAQAFFLNLSTMKWLYHPDADFKYGEMIRHESQEAFSMNLVWAGELIAQVLGKLGRHEGLQAVAA